MTKKVVLWGRGKRGEKAYNLFLDLDIDIIAVIDSNVNYHNHKWHNIMVIDMAEYLQEYTGYEVVITPKDSGDIVAALDSNNISNYSLFDDIYRWLVYPDIQYSGFNWRVYAYDNLLQRFFYGKYLTGYDAKYVTPMHLLSNAKNILITADSPSVNIVYNFFVNGKISLSVGMTIDQNFDLIIIHGLRASFFIKKVAIEAAIFDIPVLFDEDGFIRSIEPCSWENVDEKFNRSHSVVFERNSLYINANAPSYLEYMLNSDYVLSDEELLRAKKLITVIRKEKISKYNNQPIYSPSIGRKNRKKVLIIDQTYGDMSILCGMASDDTIVEMYKKAKIEYPDADIIIKTHPDNKKGHFSKFMPDDNVYLFCDYINPISLLECVDVVYVCTSQMGFEACMCGKEVHVFGMPFYAGWGFTQDRQKCNRRVRRRTVEEVFYFAYIMYSHYVSYRTNSACDIETCISEILELRDEYFSLSH